MIKSIHIALLNGFKKKETHEGSSFPGLDGSNIGFFKVPKTNKTLPSGLCSWRRKGSHRTQKTMCKHQDFNEGAFLPLNTRNTCSRVELFYKKNIFNT